MTVEQFQLLKSSAIAPITADLTVAAQAAGAAGAAPGAATATTQAGIATTQAGIATTQAGISTTQAGIATAQAALADADRIAAQAAQAAAEAAQAATELAGAALTPIDMLHPLFVGPASLPIPAGWWDTGDRLLSGAATRAIISNWNAETIRGAGPNAFILADDAARIFGADGVTPVSVPGTAVSLAADDWEGLELGAELVVNGDGSSIAGWTVSGGTLSIVGGKLRLTSTGAGSVYATQNLPTLAGKVYAHQAAFTGGSIDTYSSPVFTGFLTTLANGIRSVQPWTDTNSTLTWFWTAAGAGEVFDLSLASVREVLNWPAYQNTAAARPTWGRAPAQVRNLQSNSGFVGVVAGTPGTPPTNWAQAYSTGQLVFTASAPEGGNALRIATASQRHGYEAAGQVYETGQTVTLSAVVDVTAGVALWEMLRFRNASGAISEAYKVDGSSALDTDVISAGEHTIECTATITSTASILPQFGVGLRGNATGDITFRAVQVERGTARTNYQLTAVLGIPDITETGVRSFGVLSFDGSDDALLHQIHTGGTVAVALFGRGGSYLIPSVVLAANDVLQMGPLSVLDNGVIVPGCPTGILRAVGTVPWSSRFELVGAAIMRANPTAEERARVMRYFAAHGARGWLVEGPELITNGGFDTDVSGWVHHEISRGAMTWQSGALRLDNSGTGGNYAYQAITTVPDQLYILSAKATNNGTATNLLRAGASALSATFGTVSGALNPALVFRATGVSSFAQLSSSGLAGTASDYCDFDNVSVRTLTPEF